LTLKELARQAGGISPRSLEVYEAGKRIPRQALPAICLALDVDPHYLLTGQRRDGELGEVLAKLDAHEVMLREMTRLAADNWRAVSSRLGALEDRLRVIESPAERLSDVG
jgi:DNA-binding Xre family transcriptional regulator